MSARRLRVPHVFTLILGLTVVVAVAGTLIPAGSYQRGDDGRIVPGSFRFDPPEEAPRPGIASLPFAVLEAPLRGLVDASPIVAFLLAVGGTFRVIERSGAFPALIGLAARRLRHRGILVLPAAMVLFSIGGAVFGMSEEVIPFVILFVPLVRALGYGPVVGVAVPLVGAGMGFAGAMLNPFTVGVAQAIAGLPPISGWPLRTACWVVLTALGIVYVMQRARRERIEPSPGAAGDGSEAGAPPRLTPRRLAVLGTLALGIATMIWGIGGRDWYVLEIGAVFLGIGLASAVLAGLPATETAEAFGAGARDLLTAGIVIGMARGIVLLAGDLRVLDTTLHAAASLLATMPAALSINAMFVFQSLLNFLVPSGSGQAALTMPVMAPLADLVGLTRQQAVLAFQFGDGFTNLITPTSAVLMGSLEAGHVTYGKWLRFAGPLQLLLAATGFVLLTVAVLIGYA